MRRPSDRRSDDRPVINASALPATSLSFAADGTHPMVLCPDPGCDQWARVARGVLMPHHVAHKVRCSGSYQPIRIDVTPAEHAARLAEASHSADHRRPTRVHRVPAPPVAVPVGRVRRAAA